ncbi:MAG: hypothetical protein KF901_05900 [Myxococcales bacterium]|nr:hypothetical protein [Myxococcales bacterium]
MVYRLEKANLKWDVFAAARACDDWLDLLKLTREAEDHHPAELVQRLDDALDTAMEVASELRVGFLARTLGAVMLGAALTLTLTALSVPWVPYVGGASTLALSLWQLWNHRRDQAATKIGALRTAIDRAQTKKVAGVLDELQEQRRLSEQRYSEAEDLTTKLEKLHKLMRVRVGLAEDDPLFDVVDAMDRAFHAEEDEEPNDS